MIGEGSDPRIQPLDVAATLMEAEASIPEDLRVRSGELFLSLTARTYNRHTEALAAVEASIAADHGFANVEEFHRAEAMFMGVKGAERSGAHIAITDAIMRLMEKTQTALAALKAAMQMSELLQQGDLAHMMDHAVSVAELENQVERARQSDPLTGLMRDQDTVTRRFDIERGAFLKEGQPDEVMLWVEIDLDNFKLLNSTHGNANVDHNILKPLAAALQKAFFSTDFICRLGGDEFSVVLNRVKRDQIDAVINKVREAVSSFKLPAIEGSDEDPGHLTASMGVFAIERPQAASVDTSSTDLFMSQVRHRAIEAAYQSKKAGKDRATIWSPDMENINPTLDFIYKELLRDNAIRLQNKRAEGKHAEADKAEAIIMELAKTLHGE